MDKTLLLSTLTFAAPLILAALGGIFSERSGIINIALEGKMLAACCVASIIAQQSGNPFLALVGGIVAAMLLSLLHFTLTQNFGIDHIISGMGINAVALGGTSLANKTLSDSSKFGQINSFPIAIYWVVAALAVAGTAIYFRGTKGGLRLLAVGNDPDKSRQMGVQPEWVRLKALLMTGLFAGLAGVLIVSNAGSFNDNMTAGRGYIALAAVIIGGWRPIPALIACLAFGFFDALQLKLQGTSFLGASIPPEAWNTLPYLVTIVALAGLVTKNRPPAGLGKQ